MTGNLRTLFAMLMFLRRNQWELVGDVQWRKQLEVGDKGEKSRQKGGRAGNRFTTCPHVRLAVNTGVVLATRRSLLCLTVAQCLTDSRGRASSIIWRVKCGDGHHWEGDSGEPGYFVGVSRDP